MAPKEALVKEEEEEAMEKAKVAAKVALAKEVMQAPRLTQTVMIQTPILLALIPACQQFCHQARHQALLTHQQPLPACQLSFLEICSRQRLGLVSSVFDFLGDL